MEIYGHNGLALSEHQDLAGLPDWKYSSRQEAIKCTFFEMLMLTKILEFLFYILTTQSDDNYNNFDQHTSDESEHV